MASTTDPTTAHFREIMRRDIGAHLRAAHGMTDDDIPKSKMAQDKLHRSIDHGTHDAAAEKDTSVLAGVTRKPTEAAATNLPKPRPARKPKTDTVPLPGDSKPSKPAAKTGKPAARKPAAKPAQEQPCPYARAGKHCIGILKHEGKHILRPVPKPEPVPEEKVAANGASPREHNQELARQLLAAITTEFAGASKDDQQKVANWLHMLPTGGEGAGWLRYWPTDFPRPTSAGWRKPE
jgi:hypothetical protein